MFTRVVALTTALALSGCSFAFVHGPPPQPQPPTDCTDHYVVPAIDAAIMALALTGAVYLATTDDGGMAPLAVLVEGSIALGFGVSAIRGVTKVKRCRRARATYVPLPAPPMPVMPVMPAPQ
jgi:hypothetical protein